ncbi:FkbM family methyltransferase [filamentous cyanobacterium LEGE 11480]|uniref:FkbM family methyltransferase n=1 Tax=Romeriopsis navalis LEGE 11480 TaxID=2777977 RepID=A0A928VJ38_9CYAN|nr:FkbM family methyltransferase [Romeriopsis navalis]MBE9029541.1 FkbM family methyltransferase [Romeriopsis navalis LEGE 11480]
MFARAREYALSKLRWKFSQSRWDFLGLKCQLRSGIDIQVNSRSDWWVFNEIFVNQEYDAPIQMMFEQAVAGQSLRILDIGANVGFFAMRATDQARLKKIPVEVWAIEGSPAVFNDLKALVGMNPDLDGSLKPIHGLVGHRTGSAKIRQTQFSAMNRLVDVATDDASESVEVPFIDLNELLPSASSIDLLKCDIEGSEELFIQNYGELFKRVKMAVFEMHHNLCNTQRCCMLLAEFGLVNQSILHGKPSDPVTVNVFTR